MISMARPLQIMFILPVNSDHLSRAAALTCGRSRQVSLQHRIIVIVHVCVSVENEDIHINCILIYILRYAEFGQITMMIIKIFNQYLINMITQVIQ